MMEYGLALAGGGAKGAYQIGVWEALLKLSVPVSCITGTSVGSINAALFAEGDFDLAKRLWTEITLEQVIRLPDGVTEKNNLFSVGNFPALLREIHKNNGLAADPLRALLARLIDEKKLRSSNVEFGLTATSLSEFKNNKVFLEEIPEGQVVDFIMASACFPGLKTQYLENKPYADGGITNNLPVDMLFSRGYQNVIAVDIGGVGWVQNYGAYDRNVILIRCSENIVGVFEFEREQLLRCMRLGYLDTLKCFGRLTGERYFFNVGDYARSRGSYSAEILSGLEAAAEAFGIDRCKIYKIDSLIEGVLRGYHTVKKQLDLSEKPELFSKFKPKDPQAIVRICDMLREQPAERGNLFLNVLGENLAAAGSIAYFLKS